MARVVARTPLAPVAAFPKRAVRVARHLGQVGSRTFKWLFTSREHTNYTFELTPTNLEHLCWFIATVARTDVATVRAHIDEIDGGDFRERVRATAHRSPRRYMWDAEVRLGSRIGWYALVRAVKPQHVVEAGIDKGLGTVILAEAIRVNSAEGHPGRITAIDINPEAGDLVVGSEWEDVVNLVHDDSVTVLQGLGGPVDLFIHDSVYTDEHEQAELDALLPLLSDRAVMMNARAATTLVLPRMAESRGWNYLSFQEQPDGHWFTGDSVGIAWR